MKELEDKKLVFNDNEVTRGAASENFNFVLDKESGVSMCWGTSMNDTPEYDPCGPQEIVFNCSDFNLEKYLKMFNYFANIRIKTADNEFPEITDALVALTKDNLICMSTLASVVLIFDERFESFNFSDLSNFVKYIEKFSIPIIVQFNTNTELSYNQLTKLKLLSTSIQIKTDSNLNAEILKTNLDLFKSNGITYSVKLLVNKDSYEEVIKVPATIDKETGIKVYFVAPYVTTKQYVEVQNKFNAAGFTNSRIATCANKKFNNRKPNMTMIPCDCDACRFSLYVENETVYPCEFAKTTGLKIDFKKSLRELWYNNKIKKFRGEIISNNYCKYLGK